MAIPEFLMYGSGSLPIPLKVLDFQNGMFTVRHMLCSTIRDENDDPRTYYIGEISNISPQVNQIFSGYRKNENSFEGFDKNGDKCVFFFDEYYRIHRIDGPAAITNDGMFKFFFYAGLRYNSAEEWLNALPDKKPALFNLDEILEAQK